MTLDDRLEPQIMNNDTCIECGINFKTAKQAILSDLLEIIGVDEQTETVLKAFRDPEANGANMLRQELRQKVRQYCE